MGDPLTGTAAPARVGVVVALLALLGACAPRAAAPPQAPATETPPVAAPAPAAAAATPAPAEGGAPTGGEPAAAQSVQVVIEPKSGAQLSGKAVLTRTADGVRVTLALEGAPPGDHGVHVHENGDCSAPDGTSAGGHFNPDAHEHGLPAQAMRHLGDLGNLHVGADGKGALEITRVGANLDPGDPHSFLGRSIIVHAKVDDGGQPVGNAGARIGCGVIGP